MNISQIGVRYAKAFYSLGSEKKIVDELYKDMIEILNVIKDVNEFNLYFLNPVIKPTEKKELVKKIFEGKINKITLNLLILILENKREKYIEDIFRSFSDIYRKENNIKTVKIKSATKISKEISSIIETKLKESGASKVEMQTEVDKDLIGGFVLRIDDKQIDSSVRTSLNKYKRELLKTSI